jgi:hypothetical protein
MHSRSMRHGVLAFVTLLGCGAQPLTAGASPALPADPQIALALKEISPARIRVDIDKLVSFGTRSTLSAQDPAAIASGHGIGAAREWLKAQFELYSKECGGCLEVKTDGYTQMPEGRIPSPTVITNVYAVLKGTDAAAAQRIVLVTGHYDSRVTDVLDATRDAPGANDDASGVAVSLECARVLSRLKFPGTIIFLTVAGEEQKLYGSAHFAQMARAQGWNIVAALNNDIVGGSRGSHQQPGVVRVFSEGVPSLIDERQLQQLRSLGGESDSASRELARQIVAVAMTYQLQVHPLMIFRSDRYLRGGDHQSFTQQGFPAVRFTEYLEDFDREHQNVRVENGIEYGDLSKFVDFGYVAGVARINAATLASLAAAPGAPGAVKLAVRGLGNDSTLSWERVPNATGYEVLWRDTSSPNWQHTVNVGNVTQTTLELSKDNVIFAVRAVDAGGHRSLPAVPLPGS